MEENTTMVVKKLSEKIAESMPPLQVKSYAVFKVKN